MPLSVCPSLCLTISLPHWLIFLPVYFLCCFFLRVTSVGLSVSRSLCSICAFRSLCLSFSLSLFLSSPLSPLISLSPSLFPVLFVSHKMTHMCLRCTPQQSRMICRRMKIMIVLIPELHVLASKVCISPCTNVTAMKILLRGQGNLT